MSFSISDIIEKEEPITLQDLIDRVDEYHQTPFYQMNQIRFKNIKDLSRDTLENLLSYMRGFYRFYNICVADLIDDCETYDFDNVRFDQIIKDLTKLIKRCIKDNITKIPLDVLIEIIQYAESEMLYCITGDWNISRFYDFEKCIIKDGDEEYVDCEIYCFMNADEILSNDSNDKND